MWLGTPSEQSTRLGRCAKEMVEELGQLVHRERAPLGACRDRTLALHMSFEATQPGSTGTVQYHAPSTRARSGLLRKLSKPEEMRGIPKLTDDQARVPVLQCDAGACLRAACGLQEPPTADATCSVPLRPHSLGDAVLEIWMKLQNNV